MRRKTTINTKLGTHMAGPWHALALRLKGQSSRSHGYEVCWRRGTESADPFIRHEMNNVIASSVTKIAP